MMAERLILRALFEKEYWNKFNELFDYHFFDSLTHKTIYSYLKDFWEENDKKVLKRVSPETISSLAAIEAESDSKVLTVKQELDTIFSNEIDPLELPSILNKAIKQHHVKNIAIGALEDLEQKDLNLDKLIQNLTALNRASSFELEKPTDFIEGAKEIIESEQVGSFYPTSLPSLDEELQGGLWHGELGIIIAPPHRGKTQTLVSFGAHALRQGTDVFHATCEISETRTAIRYYQSLLKRSRKNLIESPSEISESLTNLELGKWRIRDYTSRKPTSGQIRKDLIQFLEDGAKNPLVIIDYIDFVKSSRSRSTENRLSLRATTEELREIAAEFNVGVWTASQANRASYKEAEITMADVAESVGKIEVADVVITLNQTQEEKSFNRAKFRIEKARERVIQNPIVLVATLPEFQSYKEVL